MWTLVEGIPTGLLNLFGIILVITGIILILRRLRRYGFALLIVGTGLIALSLCLVLLALTRIG